MKPNSRLVFVGERTQSQPPWFVPDRLENVRHDANDDESMTVLDANGVPVFGRIVENARAMWVCKLNDWAYTKGEQ